MGERYGRILAALPACELVAVADLDVSKAHTLAAQLGAESCSTDALIARPDVDAICVCTPEDTHAEIACAVLVSRKDLLVEKPLARSSAEAHRIAAAAEASGRIATVGHLLRFEPHYAAAYQRLQAGSIGALLYAVAWRESTRASATRYVSRSSVRMHLMVHDIDLLRWFSGAEVLRIQAACPNAPSPGSGAGGAEAVTAILEFTNGMTATLVHSWALPSSTPSPLRTGVRVVGKKGEVGVDFSLPAVTVSGETGHTHLLTEYFTELPTAQLAGCLRSQIEHFVHCVAARTAPLVSVNDGLRAVEVAEGIQQAIEGQLHVTLSYA
jgi:UDP-N-acetylglucosamine 3-dehydrogenase